MTEPRAETVRALWLEDLDYALSAQDASEVEKRFGFGQLALNQPDEWVLGYRVISPLESESATVLYLTRRFGSNGVRFTMRTSEVTEPETAELHDQVKQYIQESTPVVVARADEGARGASGRRAWLSAWSIVVDRSLQERILGQKDLALARGHVSELMSFKVSGPVADIFASAVQCELYFHVNGDEMDVKIGLEAGRLASQFDRFRVRVSSGDHVQHARFSSFGVATVKNLEVDRHADLLHLAFEFKDS